MKKNFKTGKFVLKTKWKKVFEKNEKNTSFWRVIGVELPCFVDSRAVNSHENGPFWAKLFCILYSVTWVTSITWENW